MTDFENFEVPYEGPYEEDEDYFGFRENNFDERDFDEKESGGDQNAKSQLGNKKPTANMVMQHHPRRKNQISLKTI